MAQNDTFKRYLDAGMAFTQLTRERAEEFVKELVKNGEVQRKQAEAAIEDLLERSRKNTDELVSLVRREIADQLKNLGLEDVAKRAGLTGHDTKTVAKADPAAAKADTVAAKADTAAAKADTAAAKADTAAAKAVAPAKKDPAKKAAATSEKKPAAKKSPAKKAAAKKTS